jgi:mitochondrial import inner membrane translocase subunit TIM16
MAVGPLARLLAQLVVPVVAVLARALPAAYAQALQNARKAGVSSNEATKNLLRKTISKSEALQVLNLPEKEATVEAIQRVRRSNRGVHLFAPQTCFVHSPISPGPLLVREL